MVEMASGTGEARGEVRASPHFPPVRRRNNNNYHQLHLYSRIIIIHDLKFPANIDFMLFLLTLSDTNLQYHSRH